MRAVKKLLDQNQQLYAPKLQLFVQVNNKITLSLSILIAGTVETT